MPAFQRFLNPDPIVEPLRPEDWEGIDRREFYKPIEIQRWSEVCERLERIESHLMERERKEILDDYYRLTGERIK